MGDLLVDLELLRRAGSARGSSACCCWWCATVVDRAAAAGEGTTNKGRNRCPRPAAAAVGSGTRPGECCCSAGCCWCCRWEKEAAWRWARPGCWLRLWWPEVKKGSARGCWQGAQSGDLGAWLDVAANGERGNGGGAAVGLGGEKDQFRFRIWWGFLRRLVRIRISWDLILWLGFRIWWRFRGGLVGIRFGLWVWIKWVMGLTNGPPTGLG